MTNKPVKLLIVDDQESVHRALELSLRREPFDILHAYDAAEALYILEQQGDVQGIISDHNMPGITGIEFLVQVRLRYPHIVSLLLTAEATVELAETAVNAAGVKGLLAKPWRAADLRNVLRDMLLPDAGRTALELEAVDAVERSLREEMRAGQDPDTGAYIIDENLL